VLFREKVDFFDGSTTSRSPNLTGQHLKKASFFGLVFDDPKGVK